MLLLVLIWTVCVFIIVVALLSDSGKNGDNLRQRVKSIEGRNTGNKQDNIAELNGTFFERFISPTTNKVKEIFTRINTSEGRRIKETNQTKIIETKLRLAGIDLSVSAFLLYKKFFMGVVIVISVFLALILDMEATFKLLIALGGFALALLVPNMLLNSLANSRQNAIKRQLPDAMDLLGVCIEAGLSFDNSLVKVSEKLEGPFIEELMVVYREIQMGVPRNDALKKLSEGSNIPELKTFISALIQANQLGIPINNVMAVQSAQLRETRRQDAREKGAKAPVKMLIPMLLFIFPVVFIVLMAPTVLNVIEMFG